LAPTITGPSGAIAPSSYTLNGTAEPTLAALDAGLAALPIANGSTATVGVLYPVPSTATSGQSITDLLGATVTAGGVTSTSVSATATDTVNAPNLALTKSDNGPWTIGQTGSTYTITPKNTGNVATSGIITVTDTLPSNLTANGNPTGTGWTCTGAGTNTISCTSTTAIAAGANGSAITVTVNVASGTPTGANAISNIAATYGGSDPTHTNAGSAATSPVDKTTINATPTLTNTTSNSSVTPGTTATDTYTLKNLSGQNGTFNVPAAPTITGPSGAITPSSYTLNGAAEPTLAALNSALATLPITNGSTATVGVLYPVPATATSGQSITDLLAATVTAGGVTSTSVSATATDTVNAPSLALTKADNGPWTIGQTGATYTITPKNTGNVATSGTITVTDTLPSNLTANGNPTGTGWTCTGAGTATISCGSTTAIAAGANGNAITVAVNVGTGTPTGTNSITNTATVYGGGDPTHTNPGSGATNPPDKSTVNGTPSLTNTTTNNSVTPGTNAADTFTLTNKAGQTGTFNVPTAPTITGPTGPIAPTSYTLNGTPEASLAALNAALAALPVANGATATIGVVYPVPATLTAGQTITDQLPATITAGGVTSAPVPATATDTVNAPTLALTKTDNGPWTIGQTGATYTITPKNTGNAATTGTVTVTDTLPSNLTANGNPTGTSWTCTGASTATISCTSTTAIAAGANGNAITVAVNVGTGTPTGTNSITNTATVYGGGDPTHTNPGSGATNPPDKTTVNGTPSLTNTTSNSSVTPGTTATDTFTLKNASGQSGTFNVPAASTITGPSGAITPTSYTLNGTAEATLAALNSALAALPVANGATATVGVLYPVPATVTAGQSITDLLAATITAGGVTSTSVSATATDTVNAPSLALTKADNGPWTIGQTGATYTITPKNTGNVATSGTITVTDTLPSNLTANGDPTGTGWTCTGAGTSTISCTSSTTLAAAASGNAITIAVNVGAGTPTGANAISNVASAYGGGDPTHTNAGSGASSPVDKTTINATPTLTNTTSNTTISPNTTATDTFTLTNSAGQTGTFNVPAAPIITGPSGVIAPSSYTLNGAPYATLAALNTALAALPVANGASVTIGVLSPVPATLTSGQTITDRLGATITAGGVISAPALATATDTVNAPSLAVTKSDNGPWTIGQTGASYTIVAKNTGNAASAGTIMVTDTLPSGLTANGNATGTGWTCTGAGTATISCTSTTVIAPGASGNAITVPVLIGTSTATGANAINNSASIFGGNDPTHTNAGSAATSPPDKTTINPVPSLTNTASNNAGATGLTASGGSVAPGSPATDTFKLTNLASQTGTFNVPAAPTITGPTGAISPSSYTLNGTSYASLAALDAALAALPVASGATASIGVQYAVPSGMTAGATISDQLGATVTAGGVASALALSTAFDSAIVPVANGIKSVKLTTDANGNAVPSVGDTLTYTIGYANTGTASITNVQITDDLPSGTSLVAGSVAIVSSSGVTPAPAANAAYDGVANPNLLAAGATMGPGSTLVVSFRVTIGNGTTPITNRATLTGGGLTSGVQTSAADSATTGLPAGLTVPAGSINQGANGVPNAGAPLNASTTVTPATIASAGVKSAQNVTEPGKSVAIPGDTIAYTITYANTGTAPIAGVSISDPLPDGVTLVGAPHISTAGASTALPSPNPSYNGESTSALFASPVVLSVGASLTVTIDATINASTSGTLLNRATMTGLGLASGGIASSAADSSTTGLPAGVTVPAGSVDQGPNVTPNTGPPLAAATSVTVKGTTRALIVTKTVDRAVVSGGDPLRYMITVTNPNAYAVSALSIVDSLPAGVAYARGTTVIDNVPQPDPVIAGRTLTWTIASAAAGGQHTILFASTVAPGVAVGSSLTNTASANAKSPSGATIIGPNAQAQSTVVGGIFNSCVTIIGRVFVDRAKTGRYAPGDTGLAGVRIYLESGESVVTDRTGKYSFACINPGMHALRLDTTTLPPGTRPYDVHDNDDPRSIVRLVHGTLDAGMIDNINFAIFGESTRDSNEHL
jgi:uncharacterized repeat protein (TIGR01451 family)